jgi:serine/threonine protein phosphatase 1
MKEIYEIKEVDSCFVIGDVHGEIKSLKRLIKENTKNDIVVLVGDLIDRGLSSLKVIEYVIKKGFYTVKGNHEEMMLENRSTFKKIIKLSKSYKKKEIKEEFYNEEYNKLKLDLKFSDWWLNGGEKLFKEYENKNDSFKTLKKHILYLESLPYMIIVSFKKDNKTPLLISHSLSTYLYEEYRDLVNKKDKNSVDFSRKEKLEAEIIWNRNSHRSSKKNKTAFFNIFGHTPVDTYDKKTTRKNGFPKPIIDLEFGCAAIDTGCVYTTKKYMRGYLTGILFPKLKIIQIDNKGEV